MFHNCVRKLASQRLWISKRFCIRRSPGATINLLSSSLILSMTKEPIVTSPTLSSLPLLRTVMNEFHVLSKCMRINLNKTNHVRTFPEIDESCSVSPNDRNDCGWYGIDQDTCEGRGCCYDDTDFGFETKYCFYPTG